jgi:hypothetical protein
MTLVAATTPAALPPATTPAEKPAPEATTRDTESPAVSSTAPPASNPPAATPATSSAKSPISARAMLAPPDAAATKLTKPETPASAVTASPIPEVVAAAPAAGEPEPDPPWTPAKVQKTEFGVDVGSANSLGGLRALWRGLLKSHAALSTLRPIIVVKEGNNGLGMQLRLVAGPLDDAATAAKICAVLMESQRICESTLFDGQRLVMRNDEQPPASAKPVQRRRSPARHAMREEPPPPPPPVRAAETSTLSSLLGRNGNTGR